MLRSLLLFLSIVGVPTAFQTDQGIFDLSALQFQSDNAIQYEKELLNIHYIPSISPRSFPQSIQAKAAIVMDPNSAYTYFSKAAEQKLPIASLTKIMTAIVILEENKFDEQVMVDFDPQTIEGRKMGLYQNEVLLLRSLLQGIIIHSANDAAMALARHNAGNMEAFVTKMNQKAKLLGLKNTHFANSIGLDDPNNYSSAQDLAILSMYALKKPFFRETTQITGVSVYSLSGLEHKLETTNLLLHNSYLPIFGLKTGTTDDAGECFIGLLNTPRKHELLVILLNSPNRFQEMKALSEIILKNNNL